MKVGEKEAQGVGEWDTLSHEDVADCRIFDVDRVERRNRDTGAEGKFYRIRSKDWVNVIALTDDGRVVLIRQFRHGTGELTLEIPGGILDDGESPIEAARRELREETGYECAHAVEIGRVRPNPAIFDNSMYTVLATGLTLGATQWDEHEEIEIVYRPIAEIDDMLRRGEIDHALVVAALFWYRLHTPGDVGGVRV